MENAWGFPYLNIPLPRWNVRTKQNAHIKAQQLTADGFVELEKTQCPYQLLHSAQLIDYEGPRVSGAHCALKDVKEHLQHILDNRLSRVLKFFV